MSEKAKLFSKMVKVMSHLDRIEKRGHNTFFNYDFVTSDDVLDAVRKAMVSEGLALFVNLVDVKTVETGGMDKQGKPKSKHVADFEFNLADGETGEVLTCLWKGEAMDTEDKALSKCATSAEKYFLLKTFLIGTGDEPDPDEGDDTGQKAAVKFPKSQQSKQPEPVKPKSAPLSDIPQALEHLANVCTHEGEPYVFLTSAQLANMSIGIGKALAKNGLDPDKKAEYERKQSAIAEILEWRNANPTA